MALTDYLDDLGELASDALSSSSVRVAVKTNLGPEFEVAGGESDGGGLARALGIKAAVIVRDRSGRELFRYGDPPPTNPALVVVLLAVVAVLGFVLVRGVLKR